MRERGEREGEREGGGERETHTVIGRKTDRLTETDRQTRGQTTTIFLNLPLGQVAIKINLPKITLTCPNNNFFYIVHY